MADDLNLIKTNNSLHLKLIKKKADLPDNSGRNNSKQVDGYLIDTNENEKEARRIIAALKARNFKGKIAIQGGTASYNRRIIETMQVNWLVSPEAASQKDSLKQRDAGFNHVLAKAATGKLAIVISISELMSIKGKARARRLARIMQNIRICRKAKCQIKIASLANKKEAIIDKYSRKALGSSLGMSSQQVKNAVEF
ncbi:MAG: RNase P subunit p30 family protein [Candidatus Nanoarchaeia archaeon]